jgi:uncharacterized protein (DUF1697 family)
VSTPRSSPARRRSTTYVSLLRGVNLGPANQVPMPELKKLYADLGLDAVETYIRSGNVVFASGERPDVLRARIERAVSDRFAITVEVVLRTHEEMADVVARNPFPDVDAAHVAVVFLSAPAPGALTDRLGSADFGSDRYVVDGREIYLHLPNGFGRSRLAARMSALRDPVAGTVRNWRTVSRLVDMSS